MCIRDSLTTSTKGQTPHATVTNDQGEYKFTALVPGTYTLQVDLAGFKQQTKTVEVQAGINNVEDILLELESLTANVMVVASEEAVNTISTAEPTSLKQETLQNL